MAYYLVENFNNGLDLRRSIEVAPTGSLRVLRNAVINAGGEIERRKAFSRNATLTDYCQLSTHRNRISGPHQIPGYPGHAFFKHRGSTLPGGVWTAGSGSVAEYVDVGTGLNALRFWAMKSSQAVPNFGAIFHAASYSEFAANGYLVEQYIQNPSLEFTQHHFEITFTNGEPTAETYVTANLDRDFQITLDSKGYVVNGDILYSSAVGDPTDMAGTGAGFLNLSSQGKPIGKALSLAEYFGQLVVCGRRGVQFYTVDPDFAQNQYQRTITTSVFAPRSMTGYADGDVIYLGRNGIRSLQARDSSNLAAVTDVGSPIDALVQDELRYDADDVEYIFSTAYADQPLSDLFSTAKGIVHPGTGDFWLFLKEKVFVLSRHPGAKVLAWSTFDLPSVTGDYSTVNGPIKSRWCADVAQIGETIAVRNYADEVFIYGGETGEEYDDATLEVITPYMDMGKPGDNKYFKGIDLVCEGLWDVEISTHPVGDQREIQWEKVAQINGRTRSKQRVFFEAQGTQIALRLVNKQASVARLGQVAVYFEQGAQK